MTRTVTAGLDHRFVLGHGPVAQEFPGVEVSEEPSYGTPGHHPANVSRKASLVVVGRRVRRSPFGAHIGSVTHAVLHHSTAPVAVVPHP
jgi:nucleotide-binding universal stress UspA family protein